MEKYTVVVILLYFIFRVSSDGSLMFKLKDAPQLYRDFIRRYNRTFDSEYEYNNRFKNFVQTLRYINGINSQLHMQQKVLPNKYADFSDAERRAYLRKNVKHIDPELKTILRMKDEPKVRKKLRSGSGRSTKIAYGRDDD